MRVMALLHQAEIRPTKLELLAAWLPGRPWFQGDADADVERVSACRFDDPAGAVGIETMLVRAGDGPVLHVPLTYRGAPLDGGEDWLVGTMEHSVLGKRWVYDARGDPVYAAALATAIFDGSGQAEETFEVDGKVVHRDPVMTVQGSGAPGLEVPAIEQVVRVDDADPTLVLTDAAELSVLRVLDGARTADGPTLTGAWQGRTEPVLLAYARR
jgi:hypothetical protein